MNKTKTSGAWRHAALTYTGLMHEQEDMPCQDAWQVFTGNSVTACTLSDGAGSAPLSQYGSRLLADATCTWFCENFERMYASDDIALRKAFYDHMRPLFAELAAGHGEPVTAFAATLLVIASHDDGRWISLHIGDGLILVRTGNQLIPLSLPENSAYGNETWFFTSHEAPRHTRVQKGNGFFIGHRADGFILCTDGLEHTLAEVRTGKAAKAGAMMLAWLDENSEEETDRMLTNQIPLFKESNPDDGTLVLLSSKRFEHCGPANTLSTVHQQENGIPEPRSSESSTSLHRIFRNASPVASCETPIKEPMQEPVEQTAEQPVSSWNLSRSACTWQQRLILGLSLFMAGFILGATAGIWISKHMHISRPAGINATHALYEGEPVKDDREKTTQ